MSSSSNGRKLFVSSAVAVVDIGCSSCRRRSRLLSHIFHPKPSSHNIYRPSSSSSGEASLTTMATTFSPCYSEDTKSLKAVRGLGKVGGASVAVEKVSDDPYLDFRQSMLQMILEKEIYSKDDLRQLLKCFLQLNSPYHHEIIVRAFTEIWNAVFSLTCSSYSSSSSSSSSSNCSNLHMLQQF